MHTLLRLKKALRSSPLTTFVESTQSGKFPLYRPRPLTEEEITSLEAHGNFCEDWSQIQVESGFDPHRVRQSIFYGPVCLPAFYGTVLTPGGVSVPTGIYRCTIHDSILENSHLSDVSHLSGVIVSQGAILQNVGSFVASGLTSFGSGRSIAVGNECGGRTLRIFADMPWDLAVSLITERTDTERLRSCDQHLEAWSLEMQQRLCLVGKGAMVCNTTILRNSWIGPHARIDGAAKIRNCFLQSTLEHPIEVYDGVILEGVQSREGTRFHSFCQVRDSLLMPMIRVGRQALISSSVLGQGCHIEEAEVTCSLVGPLTQMHHHSLFISGIWPEGRGNIGYGANVGSNHTGRLPDQEIHVAEGIFFGLGISMKFPCNLSEAPYSMIATGLVCAPQRLRFPFSLSLENTLPHTVLSQTLNELIPGWVFAQNSYALQRNLFKYAQRSKGFKEEITHSLLTPAIARLVLDALDRLSNITEIRDIYTEKEISGIGSHYLREPVRQKAIRTYQTYLERFAVDQALNQLENSIPLKDLSAPIDIKRLFQGDLMREISKRISMPDSIPALVRRHRTVEKRWMETVLQNGQRDVHRGKQIFGDYELVHPPQTAFLEMVQQQFEETRLRCNHLLRILRQK